MLRKGRSSFGVSLLELLIVIVILVFVAALGFAVAARAIRQSKSASCLSNLRQLGVAAALYAGDHHGYAPPFFTDTHIVEVTGTRKLIAVKGNSEAWVRAHLLYTRNAAVFFCPLDAHAHSKAPLLGDSGIRTHEWTSYSSGPPIGVEVTQNATIRLPFPGDRPTVRYAADAVLQKLEKSDYPYFTSHGDRINELYRDGHVKNVSLSGK